MINTNFRLYQKDNSKLQSSFFDLIDGDRETKQTKGLSYLFASFPDLVIKLLKLPCIYSELKKLKKFAIKDINQCDFIQIDAEMISEGNPPIRRDITITFYSKNVKKLVLVIEAKSAKLKNAKQIKSQLLKYFDSAHYPSDSNVPKLGIALTKYRQSGLDEVHFVSLTWQDTYSLLSQYLNENKKSLFSMKLIREYLDFLLRVDGDMKFYEVEVLSVPASKTYEYISKYSIHACPNDLKGFSYKTPLYITFRKEGGEMEMLYKTEEIIVLDPFSPSLDTLLDNSNVKYKEKLKGYIKERKAKWRFGHPGEDYRFYILSETDTISLQHKPRKSIKGHCYFSLSELLSEKKDVVVESRK